QRLFRRLGLRLFVLQQLVERALVYMILEQVRVFVLPVETPTVDEEAVVLAVDSNGRQRAGLALLAGHDLAAPAVLHIGEEVDAVLFFVGEDDVLPAVTIKIDKTKAVIVF